MKRNLFIIIYIFIFIDYYSQIDTSLYSIEWTGTDSILIPKQNKADILKGSGDFQQSITEYKKLIAKKSIDWNIYNLATVYSIIEKKDSAFKYLVLALKNDSNNRVLVDPDFYHLINDRRWQVIEDQQMKKIQTKTNYIYKHPEISKELFRINIKDQAYYFEIEIMEKKYGRSSKQVDSLWKLKEKLNSSNLSRLKLLISKYGWIKISEYGHRASNTAFLVIQHSDYKTQKKYLPLLEEACKQKEADWQNYALMKDRILITENKLQIYGSQVNYNESKKIYELFPLEDPSNVDKRRADIGMEPLKNYVSTWGIDFNISQNK